MHRNTLCLFPICISQTPCISHWPSCSGLEILSMEATEWLCHNWQVCQMAGAATWNISDINTQDWIEIVSSSSQCASVLYFIRKEMGYQWLTSDWTRSYSEKSVHCTCTPHIIRQRAMAEDGSRNWKYNKSILSYLNAVICNNMLKYEKYETC